MPIVSEIQSVNTSTINYVFKAHNGKVYSTTSGEIEEIEYKNRKIMAIGFFTQDNAFAGAILDVSSFDIYYNEGFSIARQDTIKTDTLFYSNDGLEKPNHLLFLNDNISSRVTAIGLGKNPYEISERLDVIASDYSSIYEDNQFVRFSPNNSETIANPKGVCLSYVSNSTYMPLYPTRNGYEYIMFIYRTKYEQNGVELEKEYWEAIKLSDYGNIKTTIKYERS